MTHRNKIVLVCIDAHPKSRLLLRAAANKARALNCKWMALYIETPEHYVADGETRERILRFLTIAEEMGGEVYQIEGSGAVEGIAAFIKSSDTETHRIHSVIMGQSHKEGFFAELKTSVAARVAAELRKTQIEVQIIPLTGRHYTASWFDRLRLREVKLREIAYALLSVLCAYGVSELLHANVPMIEWKIQSSNVMAFFLIACVITSLRYGLIPGLVSALAGFTTINYFYIMPLHNFDIDHSGDAIGLSIFLLSSITVALMGAFSRAGNAALIRKERRSQLLYKIHRIASESHDQQQAMEIIHRELSNLLEMDVAFFLPELMDHQKINPVYPNNIELSDHDIQALRSCWISMRTTGIGTLNNFQSTWRFEPLVTTSGEIGVMGIKVPQQMRLDASFGRLIMALADQAAAIFERLELNHMMSESRMREDREKLRSMLLSSVSHDLKTPLASIIGSLSVYNRMKKSGRLTPEIADELTDTALEEAQRLDSFITNILDMTRIESGEITFDSEWINVEEPLNHVQKRLRQRLVKHHLVIDKPQGVAEAKMDMMMTEQVLQNVIDNAAKYSPVDTTIRISYGKDGDGFSYKVRDQGPGIPPDKLEAVFDKYERLRHTDSQAAGTGLGLAICKAIMEKQNGTATIRNHEEGGAEFTIWFPDYKEIEAETYENKEKVA